MHTSASVSFCWSRAPNAMELSPQTTVFAMNLIVTQVAVKSSFILLAGYLYFEPVQRMKLKPW